jgi:hypothetical protein
VEKKPGVLDLIVKYWVLIFFIGTLLVNAIRSEIKLEGKLDKEEARMLIMEALNEHESRQKDRDSKADQVPVIQEQLRSISAQVSAQGGQINEIYKYLLKKER